MTMGLRDVSAERRYAPGMDRHGVTERSRADILAELDQLGRDRLTHGKEDRAREYARAWHVINDGGEEVAVGHAVYRVVGE